LLVIIYKPFPQSVIVSDNNIPFMYDYLNNVINQTSSVPIILNNWCSTVYQGQNWHR